MHFFIAYIHFRADAACLFIGILCIIRILLYPVGNFINGGSEFLHGTCLLGCALGECLGTACNLLGTTCNLCGTLVDLLHGVVELIGNAAERNQQRMEASGIFCFTDRIHRKIAVCHFCKEFIFIINDNLQLMD